MPRTVFIILFAAASIGAIHANAQPADAQPADVSESSADLLDAYRDESHERWETTISQMEAQDQAETDPENAILFIGSSSIRLWDTIAEDMAPYPVIQRGFGGSKYSDVAVYAKRLIHPHQYRALVLFVANDVSGSPQDHTPEEVEKLVRYIIDVSKDHQPGAPIFLIEITPTLSRWKVWPQTRQLNARLREIALTEPQTYFIATAGDYLNPDKQPRRALFVDDLLHLNREGYRRWSEIIRQRLDTVLAGSAATQR